MSKSRRPSAKNGGVSIAEARRAAREIKAKRRKGGFKISERDRKRFLGHFGPPVRAAAKKRHGARKSSRKRAA